MTKSDNVIDITTAMKATYDAYSITSGGGGGGGNMLEQRISKLEQDVVYIKAKIETMPTTLQMLLMIITVFAVGMGTPALTQYITNQNSVTVQQNSSQETTTFD